MKSNRSPLPFTSPLSISANRDLFGGKRLVTGFFSTLAFVAGFLGNPCGQAADLVWDVAPGTVGVGNGAVTGGLGTWDLANGNWTVDGGVNNIAWVNNAPPDNATFGGAGAAVTLGAPISVGNISFTGGGYDLTGSTLTLSAATPVVDVGATFLATISSVMNGTNGFAKLGLGQLTLGGATSNSLTGTTIVNNGTLVLAKTGGATALAGTVQMGGANTNQPNLRMGASNQFGSGVVMNFVNASGNWGRFDLLDTNQTVAGLNAGNATTQGGAVIQNGGININTTTATSTLTLDGSGSYLYNGYMRNVDTGGTGKLALLKAGAGTQTLVGNQITYTGATTVNEGRLTFRDTAGVATPITVNPGGTLSTIRTTLGGVGRLTVVGNAVTLAGGILSIDNAGSGLAGGWTTFNVANGLTGSGTINVNSGVLSRDNTVVNAINTSATVNVAAGAFFGAGRGGNSTIGALNGAGVVSTLWAGANAGSITLGNGDGTGIFTGTVSGDGSNAADLTQQGGVLSVIKVGTGTQTFSGAASSYKGATTVNAGTLILDGTPLIGTLNGTGAWNVTAPGNLTVNTANATVDNWVIQAGLTGTGTLTKNGAGWFQFRGAAPANFAGSIVINNGRFGNGFNSTVWTNSTADVFVGATGELDLRTDDMRIDELTGSGTVVNTFALGETNNTLTVGSNNGSSQFDGIIRGIGGVGANNTSIDVGRNSLAKIGTGTLTLTGASVYGGTTTVSNGVIRIAGGNDRLPVGTALTVNGGATVAGTFDLNARNQTVATLSGGSGAVTGKVTNTAAGTGILTVSGTSTFDGVIQDGGAGMLTGLTKSGTGTLSLTGNNTQSGLTLITGGVLRQASATALSPNSNVNMNGGIVELGVTDFTAVLGTGNGQVQFTGNGGFGAFGGTRIVNIGGAAGTMTWNAGNFVPTGSSLILSGPNSDSTTRFLNPIDLNAGAGRIASLGGTALLDGEIVGDITNGTTLSLAVGGAAVQVSGQITASNVVVENGSPAYGTPQIILNRAGGNAITGNLQIGNLALAAPASAAGLGLGASDQIADTTVVTFGAAQGRWAYVNLNGYNETIAGLSNLPGMDGGVVQLVESSASPATNSTLTLDVTSGTQSYYGHIRDRSNGFSNHPTDGKLNFVKTGGGNQELATWNNQSWSGTTSVQQGTLKLILNNGVNLPGAISVSAGATLDLAPAGANFYNLSGAAGGAGSVLKTGTGTASFINAVSFTGDITVQEGRLRNESNNTNWSANTANLSVAGGAIFDMRADSVQVNSLNGAGTVTNSFGNGLNAYDTMTVGVSNGGGHFSGAITDGGSGSGEGRGGLSLTKAGTGTQILSGDNSYSGTTTISGGTLQIGNGGTSGSIGTGPVVDDSLLVFDRSDDTSVKSSISGTGAVTKNGAGVLNLISSNTYGGATTINAGTVRLGASTTQGLASAIWYDATDGATITTGGGGVTTWANKGTLGVAGDATAVAGQEPTLITGEPAMNNNPVIRFDAAAGGGAPFDRLTNAQNFSAGNVTVMYAGRLTGGANLRLLAGANNNWLLGTWGGNSESAFFNNNFLSNAVTADTNLRIYTGTIAADGTGAFYANGTLRGSLGGSQGPNGLSLGGGFSGNPVTEYSDGDIGELLLFNSVLTAAERQSVEDYLARKWRGTGAVNVLPTGTSVNLTTAGATLDVNGVTQTVGNITGAAGTSIVLGGGNLTSGDSLSTMFAGSITGLGNVTKAGSGTWTLSGNSSVGGNVTVDAGILSVTGAVSLVDMEVKSGATLGGTGSITSTAGLVTVQAGAFLAPGTSPGTLSFNLGGGTLDISPALGGASGALQFELGMPGTDVIALTNTTLEIGTGALEFDDFAFTDILGFGPGIYTLFDGDMALSGSLGANLTGTVAGLSSTLSTANGAQDIILTVVPEPGTLSILGLAGALMLRRRRK